MKAKVKALKWSIQIRKEPYKKLWEEESPTKCWKEQQNHQEEEFW